MNKLGFNVKRPVKFNVKKISPYKNNYTDKLKIKILNNLTGHSRLFSYSCLNKNVFNRGEIFFF